MQKPDVQVEIVETAQLKQFFDETHKKFDGMSILSYMPHATRKHVDADGVERITNTAYIITFLGILRQPQQVHVPNIILGGNGK